MHNNIDQENQLRGELMVVKSEVYDLQKQLGNTTIMANNYKDMLTQVAEAVGVIDADRNYTMDNIMAAIQNLQSGITQEPVVVSEPSLNNSQTANISYSDKSYSTEA